MKKKTIVNVMIECILIVGSILIAMFIDEYREGRKERQDEIAYLKSIREDLARDTSYFSRRIHDFDLIYFYSDSILDLFERPERYHGKVPERFLHNVYENDSSYIKPFEYTLFSIILPIYFQNSPSYESMKSNGDLKLIRDSKLLNDLNKHYSHLKFMDDAANNEVKRINELRRAFMIKSNVRFNFDMDVASTSQYLGSVELANLTYDVRQVTGFVDLIMKGKKKEAKKLILQISEYLK